MRGLGAGLLLAGAVLLAPALALLFAPAFAGAVTALPVLAEVGPWPVVSRLVGYRGRLWLANSVKGVNHNSADLYSYDPAGAPVGVRLRYERHLFSQDAGRPLVHDGLLYWPSEDTRFSLGWGDFSVTNGRDWAYGTIPTAPTAQIFHSHALAPLGGRILAATSAWRAGFQLSADGGASWTEIYDHPTPERQVSRVVRLESLGDLVFGALLARGGNGLVQSDGVRTVATPGWPGAHPVRGLAALEGWVYGLVRAPGGTVLWRSDGRVSERLADLPPAGETRDLAADGRSLWLLTRTSGGGAVWRGRDGAGWTLAHSLAGGQPSALAPLRGGIYVGGAGPNGKGLLWGPAPTGAGSAAAGGLAALPRPVADRPPPDWPRQARALERLLTDPDSYGNYARGLRDMVFDLARRDPPAGFFAARLALLLPDRKLSLIGGALEVPAAKLGQWILLWGMAVSGQGPVPAGLLAAPWTAPRNRAEKYYEPLPAALWAIAVIGQRDRATITALVDRLDRPGDPKWLQGDLIGALGAVTGARFGYDTAAWRAWWAGQEPLWAY